MGQEVSPATREVKGRQEGQGPQGTFDSSSSWFLTVDCCFLQKPSAKQGGEKGPVVQPGRKQFALADLLCNQNLLACPGIAEELVTEALLRCQTRSAMEVAARTICATLRNAQREVVQLVTERTNYQANMTNYHACHDDDCTVREFLMASQRRKRSNILGALSQPYDPECDPN